MAEISNNIVFNAVSRAIRSALGKRVFGGGSVEQGLDKGCFVIQPVTVNTTAQLGTRRRSGITFDVMYFPENGREESLDIADKLPYILFTVEGKDGDRYHCHNCECTVVDEVLHCICSYTYFGHIIPDRDEMFEMTIEEKVIK